MNIPPPGSNSYSNIAINHASSRVVTIGDSGAPVSASSGSSESAQAYVNTLYRYHLIYQQILSDSSSTPQEKADALKYDNWINDPTNGLLAQVGAEPFGDLLNPGDLNGLGGTAPGAENIPVPTDKNGKPLKFTQTSDKVLYEDGASSVVTMSSEDTETRPRHFYYQNNNTLELEGGTVTGALTDDLTPPKKMLTLTVTFADGTTKTVVYHDVTRPGFKLNIKVSDKSQVDAALLPTTPGVKIKVTEVEGEGEDGEGLDPINPKYDDSAPNEIVSRGMDIGGGVQAEFPTAIYSNLQDVKIHTNYEGDVETHEITTPGTVELWPKDFNDTVSVTQPDGDGTVWVTFSNEGKSVTYKIKGPPSKITLHALPQNVTVNDSTNPDPAQRSKKFSELSSSNIPPWAKNIEVPGSTAASATSGAQSPEAVTRLLNWLKTHGAPTLTEEKIKQAALTAGLSDEELNSPDVPPSDKVINFLKSIDPALKALLDNKDMLKYDEADGYDDDDAESKGIRKAARDRLGLILGEFYPDNVSVTTPAADGIANSDDLEIGSIWYDIFDNTNGNVRFRISGSGTEDA